MASHDRRSSTLGALASLQRQRLPGGFETTVVLVDSGSSDGTLAAVEKSFPSTKSLSVSRDSYWGESMHAAWRAAGPADFYLWLNDDVELFDDALKRLLTVAMTCSSRDLVVVGNTVDSNTGRISYGGRVRRRRFSFRFDLVDPGASVECDTFNGNCVLIPSAVYDAVGAIDKSFYQQLGDFDYGLRIKEKGLRIVSLSGFVGHCAANPQVESFRSPAVAAWKRMAVFCHKKFYPPAVWWRYARRHAPFPRVVFFLAPYVRILLGLPLH